LIAHRVNAQVVCLSLRFVTGKVTETVEDISNAVALGPKTQKSLQAATGNDEGLLPLLEPVTWKNSPNLLTIARSGTNKNGNQKVFYPPTGRSTTGSYRSNSFVAGLGINKTTASRSSKHLMSNSENGLKIDHMDVTGSVKNLNSDPFLGGHQKEWEQKSSSPAETRQCGMSAKEEFAEEVGGTSKDINSLCSNQKPADGMEPSRHDIPTMLADGDMPLRIKLHQTPITDNDSTIGMGKEVLLSDLDFSEKSATVESKQLHPNYSRILWRRKRVDTGTRKLENVVNGAKTQLVEKSTTSRPREGFSNHMIKVKRIWGVKKHKPDFLNSPQLNRLPERTKDEGSITQAEYQCKDEIPSNEDNIVLMEEKETAPFPTNPTFKLQSSPNENNDDVNSLFDTKGSQMTQQTDILGWYCAPCKDSNRRILTEVIEQPQANINNSEKNSTLLNKPVTFEGQSRLISPAKTTHPCIEVNMQPHPSPERKKSLFGIFNKARKKNAVISRMVDVSVEQPDSIDAAKQVWAVTDDQSPVTEADHLTNDEYPSDPPSATNNSKERPGTHSTLGLNQAYKEEEQLMTLVPIGLLIKMISD
jgi:hypothetical protein